MRHGDIRKLTGPGFRAYVPSKRDAVLIVAVVTVLGLAFAKLPGTTSTQGRATDIDAVFKRVWTVHGSQIQGQPKIQESPQGVVICIPAALADPRLPPSSGCDSAASMAMR